VYYSPNIIWLIKADDIGGACGTYRGEEKYAGRGLVQKTEGMRPLGKPRCIWEQSTY
jgi:hypothetical protein